MISRVVTAEILDSLEPDDPQAMRSRRDLSRIDGVLGGARWIARTAARHPESAARGIVELGAGGGLVCERLASAIPGAPITGLDLAPRPAGLPPEIDWKQGDFFDTLRGTTGEIVAGNLILHHFQDTELALLGRQLRGFRVVAFSEPLRSRVSLALSHVFAPLVGPVTRHDMPASIRAGFRPSELAPLLGLDVSKWTIHESVNRLGTIRIHAWRE